MLDSWQGGGSAADLGLASCLLDSALCLLETWSNAGDHAASIQWVCTAAQTLSSLQGWFTPPAVVLEFQVQLLLAAAPSDPAGQTPGSGLHRLAMLRTALPVSELTVLWLSAASVAALGCLPREVHERLGHKQTPVVLAWDTTVLLSVPRERQAVASASLAAALQSFAELLTPGADQPPGAALGGSGDPLRAALLSAIGWRAAGGAWDDSGQALPSPAEQARQWAAALSKADFASSRCLQNLPGWLRRAAVIVDTSGSHHHQAGTTAQKPWSAVLDGISAERIKVGQLEWGTLAAAALQQGGQEAALRVLMEGAAVALHAAAGSPPRKGNQVGAQTGAEGLLFSCDELQQSPHCMGAPVPPGYSKEFVVRKCLLLRSRGSARRCDRACLA